MQIKNLYNNIIVYKSEMPGKKKKYNARFPPARIKKIMQSDEEVGKVAAPVPVIISRALELFVHSLLTRAGEITAARKARTLTPSHLKQCIMNEQRFDFLQELFTSVPDIGNDGDSEAEPVTPITPNTPNLSLQYPFPSSAESISKEVPPRGRSRGRPRGRGRGRGEFGVTPPHMPALSRGHSTGRPRGRPRKIQAPLPIVSPDSDDESNDALELDLDSCESEDSEDSSYQIIKSKNNSQKSEASNLSLAINSNDSRNKSLEHSPLPHKESTAKQHPQVSIPSYTLPKGIQITIPDIPSVKDINSVRPTSPGVSAATHYVATANGVATCTPTSPTSVPVSVITSAQALKQQSNYNPCLPNSSSSFTSHTEIDEDYDA